MHTIDIYIVMDQSKIKAYEDLSSKMVELHGAVAGMTQHIENTAQVNATVTDLASVFLQVYVFVSAF